MADPLPPFRRRFALRRPTPTTVEAELEDHIHHVVVTVGHHDGVVTSVDGHGVRLPWSLCPGAAAQLDDLVGTRVGSRSSTIDAGAQCTHLLDAAEAAIRFAGTDAPDRRAELTVNSGDQGIVTATARRDDGFELVVRTDGRVVLDPAALEGRSLGAGFTRWAIESLDADLAELALLLRRAIWMRHSTAIDLDRFEVLRDAGVAPGSCYASQPERIDLAVRNQGTSLPALPTLPT